MKCKLQQGLDWGKKRVLDLQHYQQCLQARLSAQENYILSLLAIAQKCELYTPLKHSNSQFINEQLRMLFKQRAIQASVLSKDYSAALEELKALISSVQHDVVKVGEEIRRQQRNIRKEQHTVQTISDLRERMLKEGDQKLFVLEVSRKMKGQKTDYQQSQKIHNEQVSYQDKYEEAFRKFNQSKLPQYDTHLQTFQTQLNRTLQLTHQHSMDLLKNICIYQVSFIRNLQYDTNSSLQRLQSSQDTLKFQEISLIKQLPVLEYRVENWWNQRARVYLGHSPSENYSLLKQEEKLIIQKIQAQIFSEERFLGLKLEILSILQRYSEQSIIPSYQFLKKIQGFMTVGEKKVSLLQQIEIEERWREVVFWKLFLTDSIKNFKLDSNQIVFKKVIQLWILMTDFRLDIYQTKNLALKVAKALLLPKDQQQTLLKQIEQLQK